jgi:hypothetical protein
MSETKENEAAKMHSFVTFLGQVSDGSLKTALDKELKNVVTALNSYHANTSLDGKASLTIKIDFVQQNSIIAVTSDVKSVLPKEKLPSSVFFPTGDNMLTIENPRQQKLPFKDVINGNKVINM